MPKKIITHTLKTWVEIPILVSYTYQPQESNSHTSPGCDEQVGIDDIEVRHFEMQETRTDIRTLEELIAAILLEHVDSLNEECWEDLEKKEGGSE